MRTADPILSRPAPSTVFGLVLLAFASACLSVRHEGDALATPDSVAATERAFPDELLGELGLNQCDPDCPLASDRAQQLLEASRTNLRLRHQEEFDRRRDEIRQLRARVQESSTPAGLDELEWESHGAAQRRLAAAEEAYARWLQEVRGEALAGLPECVRQPLQRAIANRVLPEAYRGRALSSEQQSALQMTRMRYYERLALAADDEARHAVRAEYTGQMESILGEENVPAGTCQPVAAGAGPGRRQVH